MLTWHTSKKNKQNYDETNEQQAQRTRWPTDEIFCLKTQLVPCFMHFFLLLFVQTCDRRRKQQNGVPEVIVAAAAAAKGGAGRTQSAEESPEYTFEANLDNIEL